MSHYSGIQSSAYESGGPGNPLVLGGTADPSAGGGLTAPEGSVYMRNVAGAGEMWNKFGALATDWTQLGGGAAIGDAVGGGSPNSLLFVDGVGDLGQDVDLVWDATLGPYGRLGIGTAAPEYPQHIALSAIGTGATDLAVGSALINPTAATAIATVQRSPMLVLEGQGWRTIVPTTIEMQIGLQAVPISGGIVNPSFVISQNSNEAGFVDLLTVRQLSGISAQLLPNHVGGGAIYANTTSTSTGLGFSVGGTLAQMYAAGTESLRVSSGAVQPLTALQVATGTAAAPSIAFASAQTSGYFAQSTAPPILGLSMALVQVARWSQFVQDWFPRPSTSGSPTIWSVVGPLHTTLAAGIEAIDCDFDLDRNVQFSTGALATQRAVVFRPPTYAFVAASVLGDAATVAITGAPAPGPNATLTRTMALWIQAGDLRVDNAQALGGGVAPTFGTIGGTGPAAAAQFEWLRVRTQNGVGFVPVWQ